MDSLRKTIETYVESHKWDTLMGRAWDMGNADSRKEFADFLYKHVNGLAKVRTSTSSSTAIAALRAEAKARV